MSVTHRIVSAAVALAAATALSCSSTATNKAPRAQEDEAVTRLSAELVEAAALRTTLSAMRVSVHEIPGKDSVQTYGPVAAARAVELTSLGVALKDEFVSALSARLHVLAPDPLVAESGQVSGVPREARPTHEVIGHFIRLENDLLVSLRLIDADSSVIVSSVRGMVPLAPLVDQGALVWASASPRVPGQGPSAGEVDPIERSSEELSPGQRGPSVPGPAGPSRVRRAATPPGPAGPYDPAAREIGEKTATATETLTDPTSAPPAAEPAPETLAEGPPLEEPPSAPGPAAIRLHRLSDSKD